MTITLSQIRYQHFVLCFWASTLYEYEWILLLLRCQFFDIFLNLIEHFIGEWTWSKLCHSYALGEGNGWALAKTSRNPPLSVLQHKNSLCKGMFKYVQQLQDLKIIFFHHPPWKLQRVLILKGYSEIHWSEYWLFLHIIQTNLQYTDLISKGLLQKQSSFNTIGRTMHFWFLMSEHQTIQHRIQWRSIVRIILHILPT